MKEFLLREYVTAWKGRVKKQSRSLEYCNKCEDQLISGINDERLVSKLQNMGRRDKITKGMVLFLTTLQVALNSPRTSKLHRHKDIPK